MFNFSANASTISQTVPVQSSTAYPFDTSKIDPGSSISWSTGVAEPYFSHATSCWSAYTSWYNSWPGYIASNNVPVQVTTIYTTEPPDTSWTTTTIYPTAGVSVYSLCDGIPRANATPTITSYAVSTATPDVDYNEVTLSPSIPPQACVPDETDCEVFWFHSNIASNMSIYARLVSLCSNPTNNKVDCIIQGGPVRLLYFPVTTEGGLCAVNGSTITNTNANSVVTTLGTTFTSGTAYLSFEKLYAADYDIGLPGSQLPIGPSLTNTILAFRSDEISTNCFNTHFRPGSSETIGYAPGTRLNFADFNSPIPASAYRCQNQCNSLVWPDDPNDWGSPIPSTISPNYCTTIWDDFNPFLAMPTRLQTLFPEWSTCGFWNYYHQNLLFDPPTALQEATVVATPTLPIHFSTTMASPASLPSSASASRTRSIMAPTSPIAESANPNDSTSYHAATSSSDTIFRPSSVPQKQHTGGPQSVLDTAPVGSLTAPHSDKPSRTTLLFTHVGASGGSDGDAGTGDNTGIASFASTTIPYNPVAGRESGTAATANRGTSTIVIAVPLGQSTVSASIYGSDVVLGSTTLSVGQAITTSNEVISFGATGVVVSPADPTSALSGEVLAAGTKTITAQFLPGTTIAVVDGTTLYAGGPAVTTDDETISMSPTGLVAVGDGGQDHDETSLSSSTTSLFSPAAGASDGASVIPPQSGASKTSASVPGMMLIIGVFACGVLCLLAVQ